MKTIMDNNDRSNYDVGADGNNNISRRRRRSNRTLRTTTTKTASAVVSALALAAIACTTTVSVEDMVTLDADAFGRSSFSPTYSVSAFSSSSSSSPTSFQSSSSLNAISARRQHRRHGMVDRIHSNDGSMTLGTSRRQRLASMPCVLPLSLPLSLSTLKSDVTDTTGTTKDRHHLPAAAGGGGECPTGSEMLCLDQHEFEMQVGRAMDTLRSDYPSLLTHNPDYSIYDPMVELVDPSGVRLHGVNNYKNVYRLLHAIVNIFYCPARSGLTFRMCFDKARQNIRIHWNAQVIPREIFGGYKTTLHADGISIYEFDRRTGNITQHRLERLVINDAPVTPEQGIFAALRGHAIQSEVDGIPVFNLESSASSSFPLITNNAQETPFDRVLQFQPLTSMLIMNKKHSNQRCSSGMSTTNRLMMTSSSGSMLFSDSPDDDNHHHHHPQEQQQRVQSLSPQQQQQQQPASGAEDTGVVMYSSPDATASTASTNSVDVGVASGIDFDELNQKNAARKKFGLKPLSPEEFLQLQEQVAELDNEQRKKAAANAAAAEIAAEQERKKSQGNLLSNFLGNVLQDKCETNFDCEWPEVCCDLGFKKMCCSSGMRILDRPPQPTRRFGQYAEIPVPQGNDDFPPNMDPRNRGGGRR